MEMSPQNCLHLFLQNCLQLLATTYLINIKSIFNSFNNFKG